ncbi:MAG: P-loop NTPase fold protein [Cyanobacteria bacterium J06642_3]
MSRLRRHKSNLERWGLKENPFRSTPPEDPELLEKIFYGRDEVLDLAIPALYEGRNILVRGAWGIGKTSLIRNLIHQLQKEVAELDEKMLVLYFSSIPGDSPTEFYRALLLGIADSLADSDPEAAELADALLGFAVERSKTVVEGKVKLWFLSFGEREERPDSEVTPSANMEAYPLLIRFFNRAEEVFDRIVVAIDDFDKKEPMTVQNILEGSLDLFRMGKYRGFIMTGRSFTDIQDSTLKALGIFSEYVSLEPMSQEALRQITINYLNSARESPRNDAYPFNEEVINQITEYAQGIPRQLNTICEKVLRVAASGNYQKIDNTAFQEIWQNLQQEFINPLNPEIRNLLYVAHQAGGISEDISDDYLDRLNVFTYIEMIPKLKLLEEQGFLVRQEDSEGSRFLPSQLFQPRLLENPESNQEE